MSILTGNEIIKQMGEGHIRIGNFDPIRLQPNSYDLTLGSQVSFYALTENSVMIGQANKESIFERYGMLTLEDPEDKSKCGYIRYVPFLDTKANNAMLVEEIPEDDGYILLPGILYLIETNESVWSDVCVTEVSGVSSLARLGLTIHKTAGYANLGHEFHWILEVEVTHALKIYRNMKIAQMYFHTTCGNADMQYNGKYAEVQKDMGIVGALSYLDDAIDENKRKEFDRMYENENQDQAPSVEEVGTTAEPFGVPFGMDSSNMMPEVQLADGTTVPFSDLLHLEPVESSAEIVDEVVESDESKDVVLEESNDTPLSIPDETESVSIDDVIPIPTDTEIIDTEKDPIGLDQDIVFVENKPEKHISDMIEEGPIGHVEKEETLG